jgi:hypothetical protein
MLGQPRSIFILGTNMALQVAFSVGGSAYIHHWCRVILPYASFCSSDEDMVPAEGMVYRPGIEHSCQSRST